MLPRNGWFGPTLRPAKDNGSPWLIVRYAWPFRHRNSWFHRREYLPTVTLNGEPVPAEWGTCVYVLREPSYFVKVTQNAHSPLQEEIAVPLAVTASGTVHPPRPAELVYAPSNPGAEVPRVTAAPPTLRTGRRHWRDATGPLTTVLLWFFAYCLVLGPQLAALLVKL